MRQFGVIATLLVFCGCAHIPEKANENDRQILTVTIKYLEAAAATQEIAQAFDQSSRAWVFPLACPDVPEIKCSFPDELAATLEKQNERHIHLEFIHSRFRQIPFGEASERTLAVSRPGVALDGSTAAVAVAIWNEEGCSSGFVVILRLTEAGWVVEKLGEHWVT